jgi:hypothetical protein
MVPQRKQGNKYSAMTAVHLAAIGLKNSISFRELLTARSFSLNGVLFSRNKTLIATQAINIAIIFAIFLLRASRRNPFEKFSTSQCYSLTPAF